MKRLSIRFSAPWTVRWGVSVLSVAALAVAATWVAHDAITLSSLTGRLSDRRSALSASEAARQEALAPKGEAPRLSKLQLAAANQAIHRLNLPWSDLLNAVEQAAGQQVSVTLIEPDGDKRSVQIGGESATPLQMLDFVAALKRQTVLEQVALKRHEIESTGEAHPTRFVVTAVWRDAAEGR